MTDTSAVTDELQKALAAEDGGRRWLRRLAMAGALALVVGGGLLWRAKHRPPPPARFVTQAVSEGDVVEKVQATGAVQPLLQVNIGAQVNGRIVRVPVDFNSIVKKGDVLAEIDSTLYGSQVNQTQANLVQQKAQLASATSQGETARVAYERLQKLFQANLASKSDLDTSKGQYDVAMAQVDVARAAIDAMQQQLLQSRANVGYTKIYSPVDGVIITRSIDPGATVVASFQAPVLFVIAQDLRKMKVLADVDEADVGKLAEKMQADCVVDAFPGEAFHGIVSQVRFSPNNVSGVVTYSAVVEVDNPEAKLRPGMTATVTINTREARAVRRVPNAALRYRPTPPQGPDGKPIPQPPEPPLAKGHGRVFLLTSDKLGDEKDEQKVIPIGITDGLFTELTSDPLAVGTKVVTDELESEDKKKKKGPF
jgi:HlyD family secretion protein